MSDSNGNQHNSNTFEVIRAALPYVNRKSKKSMELLLQAEELAASIKSMEQDSLIESYELEEDSADMENMLIHIKELCTTPEQEMIDFVLNFIKTQKLYQSYQMFMNTNPSKGKVNGFGFGNTNNLMDFITSQLTPEQKSTFETLTMMMNTMQSS